MNVRITDPETCRGEDLTRHVEYWASKKEVDKIREHLMSTKENRYACPDGSGCPVCHGVALTKYETLMPDIFAGDDLPEGVDKL